MESVVMWRREMVEVGWERFPVILVRKERDRFIILRFLIS